jgi:hypothetical protein
LTPPFYIPCIVKGLIATTVRPLLRVAAAGKGPAANAMVEVAPQIHEGAAPVVIDVKILQV